MAQITRPVLVISGRGANRRLDVTLHVVLDADDRLPTAKRGGALAVAAEIREHDRGGAWIRRPIFTFEDVTLQGGDFNGDRMTDVALTTRLARRDLNEDLVGRDEVIAQVWLIDLRGRRPREIDSMASWPVRVV